MKVSKGISLEEKMWDEIAAYALKEERNLSDVVSRIIKTFFTPKKERAKQILKKGSK